MKRVSVIISIVVGVFVIGGGLAGGLYSLDSTYAREDRVCKVEQRLDRKILMDSARDLQRR
jgi:hypothetical protein